MSEPTHIDPDSETAPQPELDAPESDVLILPAEFFFIERVEVPAAVSPGELADYAELSMEALAPFPLEQLRWGFLAAPDGQYILIYAALFARLKRAGFEDIEHYTWVLPDFATLRQARFAEPTEIILQGENYTTAFHHPGGEALPENVRSLPAGGQNPTQSTRSTLRLRLQAVELTEKSTPTFEFETLGEASTGGHWSPLSPDEGSLWPADIRPADFKNVERSARRTTALITRIMGYAAIFALCLLLLEGLVFAGQVWLGTREAKVDDQSTAVRRIEDKQSLMNKLEQVAQNELRPIAILEAANRIRIGLGSTGIEYDEVVIDGGNRLTIEGKANTINEFNAYTEALRRSGSFSSVGDPKYITRGGKTTFTATLDYQHSEPKPLAEVTPPPRDDSSSPESTETPE